MTPKSSGVIDVSHLAKLSSIDITPAQAQKLAGQFADTLKVVAKLDELDTSKIVPTPQVTGQQNVFREDIVDQNRLLSQTEALSNAKQTHRGFFVVPVILDQS